MKKIFLALLCISFTDVAIAADFITRWDLSLSGGGATSLTFGVGTTGTVTYTWETVPAGTTGSGTFTGNNANIIGLPLGAVIRLNINPANFNRMHINNGLDRERLVDVEQWGSVAWLTMQSAYYGCSYLNIAATDIPDLSLVTSLSRMFRKCYNLNGPANINNWNTSNITDMSEMFEDALDFNQPIGNWNTNAVNTIDSMFLSAGTFNQPIGNWNISNVTNTVSMFAYASSFNQPIGNWNTATVSRMDWMFEGATSFNQPIGNWNTSNVFSMFRMFSGANSFNQPIGGWNTSDVIEIGGMFAASSFNQPIGNWDVSNVIYMSEVFVNNTSFNQPLDNWNTSNVEYMAGMFVGASSFNQPLSNWNTSNVKDMSLMFWNTTSFNQPIGNWNTSSVTDMHYMFNTATAFNQPIGNWNTSNVINMYLMFAYASSFNQSVGSWDISNVVNMNWMFDYCGMDCMNYSSTLYGWRMNPSIPSGLHLGATTMQYGINVQNARNYLINTKGWVINGDIANIGTCCFALYKVITDTICKSYTFNGQTYINSGTYLDTLSSVYGCDSIITLNLTIKSVNSTVIQSGAILTANAIGADYQWILCPSNMPIPGDTNQNFTATANGDYAVIVTENGCTDTSNCMTVVGIGISEIYENDQNIFMIYPNPASTVLYIKSDGTGPNLDKTKKELYNSVGQLIFTTTKNEIDVAEYSEGFYYLKVGNHVSKVLIE